MMTVEICMHNHFVILAIVVFTPDMGMFWGILRISSASDWY
jgi:hypothetical protein